MLCILVVEDHPLVAQATAELLERIEPDSSLLTTANAREALALVDDPGRRWDRIFLDLSVPGAYGFSLASSISKRGLAHVCCIVSALDSPDFIEQARHLGFLGYVVKASPVADLTAALAGAMRGERSFPDRRQPSAPPVRLTRRQSEILDLVRGGLSSKQIADRLGLVEGTVNNQMAAITQTLRVSTRSHALARALELGLLPLEPQAAHATHGPHRPSGERL